MKVLIPLYELLKEKVFESGYIQADETGIKVLDNKKKGHSHQGFLWAYRSVLDKMIFFEYQPGRGEAGPQELLKDFKKYLLTAGYAAYNQFALSKTIIRRS